MFLFKIGTIIANKTANNFNQSIPISLITILFSNPVNLTNLHQPWFIGRSETLSNFDVAAEIYVASIVPFYSYV